MTPKESLHRDYGLLAGFLRSLSLRLQLRTVLEFLLLLPSGFILVLLGSLFVLELRERFPYLSLFYFIVAILSLSFLLLLGLWRVFPRPSMEHVARELEKKFPQLKDDVTNSLLLFHEMKKGMGFGQISEGLIRAQIRKTVGEVCVIKPWQVVSLKWAFRHLRLLLPLILTFSLVLTIDSHFLSRSLALIIHPLPDLSLKEAFISVEPRGSIVLRGTQLVIKAKVTGNVPDKLTLIVWSEGRETMHLPMDSEGNGQFKYLMASAQFSFRFQAHGGRHASPVYNIRVVDSPEVRKIKLTLIPPDYSDLPREVKEEGHIEALKGTVVNLEAQVTRGVTEGKMILNQGTELLLKVQGDRLIGSLLVFYPGTYSIKVKDDLGFENPNPAEYQIRLIPDLYPEGEIVSPAQDLEISGNEMIPLVFHARDDFGITVIKLSYQIGEVNRFISLKNANSGRTVGPETFKWDLSSLTLTSGDKVVYRLEVLDNDSISGPKLGYSRTFTLLVRDERARVAKEGEEAQQIADAFLDLLADQLEETKDKETLIKTMNEILKRVDTNLERMKNRVERFDLEALKRNLFFLKERIFVEPKETVTQEIERLALLAEEIAKKARMNEIEALAREIKNRQRRLIDSINDLKETFTREGLEATMKELKKVEDLIRSVMEALSKLATGLPDEFINSPELRGLDFQDLFKDLEEIQKRLAAGDMAGALEAAQRLLQALSEMMAALGRAGGQASMANFNRLQGEMSHQVGELEKIVTEQKEILSQTEKIDKEVKRLIEEETGKRLSHSLSRFKEIFEQFKPFLLRDGGEGGERGDVIKEMSMLLNEGKLGKLSHLAKDLEKEISKGDETQNLIEELRKMINDLSPDSSEVMTSEDRMKFPGLSLRQNKLKERTGSLKEKLEMLAQLFSGMDTEILHDIKEATSSMGEASRRLGGEDAPGAIPPEQEAIRRLTRSQQAMQQLAQQMAMQMQAARWGYQLGYDPRPGWYYGPWVPMPTLPQPELMRPREKGLTGIDREEFAPPSKDAYQVPKILREKVMEALKEGIPSQYKREVERYFRGLTE